MTNMMVAVSITEAVAVYGIVSTVVVVGVAALLRIRG